MIKDFFYVMKMLALTAIVVAVAQIRVGQKTIEDHFHYWVNNSILVDYIDEAVDGGIALTKTVYGRADASMRVVLAKVSRKHARRDHGIHFSLKRYDQNMGARSAAPDPE